MKTLQQILESFDENVKKQNNNGSPYFPDWEEVKRFLTTAIEQATMEIVPEELRYTDENYNKYGWDCEIDGYNTARTETLAKRAELLGEQK